MKNHDLCHEDGVGWRLVWNRRGHVVGLAVMAFVPEFEHSVRLERLSDDLMWALFFTSPWGLIVGACAGGYLHMRAHRAASFPALVVELVIVASVVSGVATQLVLPVAWNLPRGRIAMIAIPLAAGLAALGTRLLKPPYWRTMDQGRTKDRGRTKNQVLRPKD